MRTLMSMIERVDEKYEKSKVTNLFPTLTKALTKMTKFTKMTKNC